MVGDTSRKSGIIAGGVLALVTLVTFAVLQFYGPESVVRQFHRVVIAVQPFEEGHQSEWGSVMRLVAGSPNLPESVQQNDVVQLARFVDWCRGYSFEIRMAEPIKVDGTSRERVFIVYYPPDPRAPRLGRTWIMIKANRRWYVSAHETAEVWRQMGWLPPGY